MQSNRNIVYLSHGGGPMPLLGDSNHNEMVKTLQQIAQEVGKPSAILIVSAHWEAKVPTVTSATAPELIYDYYGFPKESYEIKYPAPGEPRLANSVVEVLNEHNIHAVEDEKRGFDHGMFVPLKIMYPDADIPCVQLSLADSLDPQLHIAIGQSLQALNWDNLLIIGSGFSFHNMQAFFGPKSADIDAKNIAFDNWLHTVVTDKSLDETQRETKLNDWANAPSAKFCHPREEHLIPLHLCYGAAEKPSDKSFQIKVLNKHASMFHWQFN